MYMDNNLKDNVQDVDNGNEGDQAMEDCLRNPVIVRKILEHFSSKELLQISLVNKLWKYEARSVMRKRGNLIANLKSNESPEDRCAAAVALVSDVPKLGAAPFSGISFENSYLNSSHSCSFKPEDIVRIRDVNLLDELLLKNVSVTMRGPWWEFRKCPAFLLAKKVLQQFCEVLEELELSISSGQGDYIETVAQDCHFPRLKILKVSCHKFNEDFENSMRVLLARAPNLKRLHTSWDINSVLRFLQGTSIEFVYTREVSAPFHEVSENVINVVGLESLRFAYSGPGFNFERFNRIAPMLLEAPRTTRVRSMYVDAVLAVPLMCYGPCFENVKSLSMDIVHDRLEWLEPRILNIIQNFDFDRIFPNLDKVYLLAGYDYVDGLPPEPINAFIERANAVLAEPMLDRAARIKKLCLAYWGPSSVAAQFFVQMFPNVEKLEIFKGAWRGSIPIPLGSIWNWLDLHELEVDGNLLPTTGNLDSVFCGIFPEEVAELRLQDDEYLKKVNIVPVMPAVTCLRNLRTLRLEHVHLRDDPFGDDDAMFMFSKVTALLAFARQPALAVSLKICARSAPPEMDHLKPYVSVTSECL